MGIITIAGILASVVSLGFFLGDIFTPWLVLLTIRLCICFMCCTLLYATYMSFFKKGIRTSGELGILMLYALIDVLLIIFSISLLLTSDITVHELWSTHWIT